jgi:hypothetical protein
MHMEHRWGRRQDTNVPVYFLTLPTTRGTGRLLNVSCTGAWLETSVPLRLYSLLYLECFDDRAPADVRPWASVVRRTADGAGLEWCEEGGLYQMERPSRAPRSRRAHAPSTART